MKKIFFIIISVTFIIMNGSAQHPLKHWIDVVDLRYSMDQPQVNYSLTVDSSDFSSIIIGMNIKNVRDDFQLAMVRHPEYDDKYWRYVEELSVAGKAKKGVVVRADSALWKITTDGREAKIHYRIRFPKTEGTRSAWKAYLTSTGGLVGGPHSFMYVVGATLVPSYITVNAPADWQIVTGLQATTDPKIFFAPSVFAMTDDPIFIGKIKSWSFLVDGIPHRLIYWPLPNATSFDMENLLTSIKKMTEQTGLLFGRFPYRDYNFMLQDGAFGGLEHNNSVTIGAASAQLANGITGIVSEITHEFFHTWNLVRIHPAEYADVSYKDPVLSKGLWFSEGLTIFYSDLLLRRAGIPVFDTTRIQHLENLIRRYSYNPAYLKFSAEKISEAAYGTPGMLGDYAGGTHLQGEVLGAMLDIIIRDATNGNRSMDDVMRKMMQNFSGEKGFTSKDIQKAVEEICGCKLDLFFNNYVFGTKSIDFKKYLGLIGLQYSMEWKDVMGSDGKPSPDLRVFSFRKPEDDINTRIGVTNPTSCWAKAGLHTGDIVRSVNGTMVSGPDFRPLIRNAKVGDQIALEIERNGVVSKISVAISSYQQPVVKITSLQNATEKQTRLYGQWINAH
jgi:predicted metalloprotease with PDZ domain